MYKRLVMMCLTGFLSFACLSTARAKNLWYFVVDRSQSIRERNLQSPIRDAVYKTVNVRNEDDEVRIIYFDDKPGDHQRWKAMTLEAKADFQEEFKKKFRPAGRTRLFDTVARVIEEVNKDADDFEAVNVLILSDGEDSKDGAHLDWTDVDLMAGQLKADKKESLLLWYTLGFTPKTPPKNIELSVVSEPAEVKTFEPPPKVAFDVTPSRVTAGEEVSFDLKLQAGGAAAACVWSFGDGKKVSLTGKDLDAKHKYESVGVFDVSAEVEGPGGKDTATVRGAVKVMAAIPVVADFKWTPEDPRVNEEVTFVNLSSGGPTKHEWSIGGASSQKVAPVHTFAKPGSVKVSLKVTGEKGVSEVSKDIVVRPPMPSPDFTCDPSDVYIIGKGDLKLSASTSEAGVEHKWILPDGQKLSGRNASVTPTKVGMYEIWHQVKSAGGVATKSDKVYVRTQEKPDPDFKLSKTSVEIGSEDAYFNCTAEEARPGHTHKWTVVGVGETGEGATFRWEPSEAGEYTIRHDVEGPGGKDTAEKGVIVIKPEGVVVDFAVNRKKGKAPLSVSFTDKSEGKVAAYQWDFGDGGTSEMKNPEHEYKNAGTYEVSLKVTNPAGKETVSTKPCVITVIPPPPTWLLPSCFAGGIILGALIVFMVFRPPTVNGTAKWAKQSGDGKGEVILLGRGKCDLVKQVNDTKSESMDEWKPDEALAIVRKRNKAYYLYKGGYEDRLLNLPKDEFEHDGISFVYENEFDEPVDPDAELDNFEELE